MGLPNANLLDEQQLWTVTDVANALKVPVSWVYDHSRDRRGMERIPHIKIGKYLRFQPSEVFAWLERMRGN